MKEIRRKELLAGIILLATFALWTVLIRHIDVQKAGPNGTEIGFATINVWFHRLTGVHMLVYKITDWLGLVPIIICMCFGVLGLVQLIKRRSILRVDPDILLLGIYYVLVIACYLIFEMIPINYRPILINGNLEASYPSSTTIALFVFAFSLFMVTGRLISGVHWATDIIGSVFLSSGLFMVYRSMAEYTGYRKNI